MKQLFALKNKLPFILLFLFCFQHSYSQTTNLWITLKPNAGSTSQVSGDLQINNGSTIVNTSSSTVSCSQSKSNNDLVYTIRYNGSDLNKDGVKDQISFDLKTKAYTGATYNYSTTANTSSVTNYGAQSDVTLINNSWGVFGDYDVDAGESLVYKIENLTINGLSSNLNISTQFTSVDLIEPNGGRDHLMIFGFGNNLASLEIDSNKTIPLSIPDTFSVTGAGSFYAGTSEWSITSLTFKMEITDSNATLDLSDYTSFQNGSTFYHNYPAQTVKKTKLPSFSWNKIPRWVAARSTVAFSDQQIKDIANNYQLIMLEKANSQGFTYIEDGVKNAATRLKAVNPKLTTLFYYNTFINYGGYKANIEYNQNAAAWSTYEKNPTTGLQQIYLFKDLYYWYNPEIEGMRTWWIKTCVEMANLDAIDGVFIDKVVNPDNKGDAFDINGNPLNNYVKMLNDLYKQLPANKLLIGNNLRNERAGGSRDLMNTLDGSYMERWEFPSTGQSSADAIAVSIQLMREALQKGKMINLQSGPNPSEDDPLPTDPAELLAFTKKNVYFPLAVYLIIAEENAYFSYTTGVDAKSTSGNLWDTSFIDEFNYFLGQPTGAPTKKGYIYERSFENLDLWVNIETKETVFKWKDKTKLSNENDYTAALNTTTLTPNPVKNNFTLSQEITSATIYNMVGQKIMSFSKNRDHYDVSMLQNGEYIIKLILENGKNQTIRFIKN